MPAGSDGHGTIVEDDRDIFGIWFDNDDCHKVGVNGVTAMVAYPDHNFEPWIKVFRGDHLWARIPARLCQIVYQSDKG